MNEDLSTKRAGYVDDGGCFFCNSCWAGEVGSGRRANELLGTDGDPDDEAPTFWVVDDCCKCRRPIKYKSIERLA